MKITLCDDSLTDLCEIEKMLLKYKTLYPGRDFELEKFSDPSLLCQRISSGSLADIYILDMLMPGQTGIDLGNLIRSSGSESTIIYVTSSNDYALDAYGVHAVRYLLKPVDEYRLFEALDYGLYFTKIKTEPLYVVKTKNGLSQTPFSKIEYIENTGRRLEVHLADGRILKSLFIRKSFEEETREILEKRNFQQIHKSFLVNLDYVKQLAANSITVESGRQLPVSKANAARAKREYLLFVSEKYGRGQQAAWDVPQSAQGGYNNDLL